MTTTNASTQIVETDTGNFAFSFGEPEPVLDRSLCDYTGVFTNTQGEYYVPPVSLTGIAKLVRANGHHESALFFKRNMTIKYLMQNNYISRADVRYLALDFCVFGQMYLQRVSTRIGSLSRLKRLPAINMRKKLDGTYCQLLSSSYFGVSNNKVDYAPNEVISVHEADAMQDIYGVPSYLGGMQSVLLSESATLFRRQYYLNGNHAGYIVVTDGLPKKVTDKLGKQVVASRKLGNFSNFMVSAPKSHGQRSTAKDRIEIKPIGELGQHDDYAKIKSITLQEILVMHRIPPALSAMMPENTGGFGDISKISEINYHNEVVPMQAMLQEFNQWLPRKAHFVFDVPVFTDDK